MYNILINVHNYSYSELSPPSFDPEQSFACLSNVRMGFLPPPQNCVCVCECKCVGVYVHMCPVMNWHPIQDVLMPTDPHRNVHIWCIVYSFLFQFLLESHFCPYIVPPYIVPYIHHISLSSSPSVLPIVHGLFFFAFLPVLLLSVLLSFVVFLYSQLLTLFKILKAYNTNVLNKTLGRNVWMSYRKSGTIPIAEMYL